MGDETRYDDPEFEREKAKRRENVLGLFRLGKVVCTPGALEAVPGDDITKAIGRHVRGDWGDVCREDWRENELSLKEGFRLLSVYRGTNGTRFWIITEADRSVTTVLLPEEY